ncbi:hypothetical protein L1987_49606 [Smallanthus sonchifolius]|uniref:Uncharacterized protein n=1 Tax=Smallanthus sonchifolius TaxID=185202 RepID=A0ACB9FW78_9ASTR|nr:hypothetical protein L1987_49606 [Smallanthus sonchifolius]
MSATSGEEPCSRIGFRKAFIRNPWRFWVRFRKNHNRFLTATTIRFISSKRFQPDRHHHRSYYPNRHTHYLLQLYIKLDFNADERWIVKANKQYKIGGGLRSWRQHSFIV